MFVAVGGEDVAPLSGISACWDSDAYDVREERDVAEKKLMFELQCFILGFLVGCAHLVAEGFKVLFGVDGF